MDILKVNEIASSHGLKAMLFGMPGSGKTFMSTTTPEPDKTIILSAESGLLSIKDSDLDVTVIKTIDDLLTAYEYLRGDDSKYTWVILDSISEIAEVVLANEKSKVKDMRQAYGALIERMIKLCKSFRDLVGVNVIFIAKEQIFQSEGFGAPTHIASFPGSRLQSEIPFLFDCNLCLRVRTDEETGEIKRAVMCMPDEQYNSIKDRSGKLDAFMSPDWSVIFDKINE